MVRLVDDLLDVSRITHNRLELRETASSSVRWSSKPSKPVRPLAEAIGHELQRDVAGGADSICDADLARLAQVFGNLLSNSLQVHGLRRPDHVDGATARGNEAVVRSTDNGDRHSADKLTASSRCSRRSTARFGARTRRPRDRPDAGKATRRHARRRRRSAQRRRRPGQRVRRAVARRPVGASNRAAAAPTAAQAECRAAASSSSTTIPTPLRR